MRARVFAKTLAPHFFLRQKLLPPKKMWARSKKCPYFMPLAHIFGRKNPCFCGRRSMRPCPSCMCPHTTIYVSSYYCVLILLYMCPHTTVSSYYCMCPHTTICVLILLYLCPHTTISVSSNYYICVLVLPYVSSYYYTFVLILVYMYYL